MIAWQERHNYPLTFFTEASIDLADDPELIDLMVQANFIATFIGIESPDEESLREAKKFQNVRAGGTLLEKVHRIQDAGMEVWCGMIMGFDHDDDGIFDRQVQFIQDARIAFAMSGMLSAIPKTPLHDRLAADGRLDPADTCEYGTNVIPLLMSREELRDGYVRVMNELYDPEAYFERTESLFLEPSFDVGIKKRRYWLSWPRSFPLEVLMTFQGIGLFARLMTRVGERASPPRVSQAPLATPEGPPTPGARPALPLPHGHALSCLPVGQTGGQPRTATDQLLLRIRGFEGSTVER